MQFSTGHLHRFSLETILTRAFKNCKKFFQKISADKADGYHFAVFQFKNNFQTVGISAQRLSLLTGNSVSAMLRRAVEFEFFIQWESPRFPGAVFRLFAV